MNKFDVVFLIAAQDTHNKIYQKIHTLYRPTACCHLLPRV